MSEMNDVSFYVPCFNAERTIAACLESILRQSVSAREIMVVDDGSTDRSAEIVSRYPVKLIRHRVNRGVAAARNSALRELQGVFIASIDADCVCEKDWLERLMDHFASDRIIGAGGKLLEGRQSRPADLWRAVHMKQHWGDEPVEPDFLYGANTVFRRQALGPAGPYDESLKKNYEDIDLCARLKKTGGAFVYEPRAVAYHLREDDARTVLDTYWQWYAPYYRQEKLYESPEKFRHKLCENLGTANRYLEEDMTQGRKTLLFLDFLFAFHHSLKDLGYVMAERQEGLKTEASRLSLWAALADLVFLSRTDADTARVRTLVKPSSALEQNCLALILCLGRTLTDMFGEGDFEKILLEHLLGSLFGIEDGALSAIVGDLLVRRPDWKELSAKEHVHLDHVFLETFISTFKTYMNSFVRRFPDAAEAIRDAAKKDGSLCSNRGVHERAS